MIENFLRRPRGVAEILADAVRVAGVLSILVAAIWWTGTDAGILSLALPALLAPRFVGVRPGFDIAYGVTVLVASWSNVLDLYRTITGWDLVVHTVCTGLIAAIAYLALVRWGIAPPPREARRAAVIFTAALGLAASAVWEIIEWIGKTFVTDEIFVTYTDTIGDMAVGALGSIAAGFLVARVRLLRD
ncbi:MULTISPECIES: DUF2238 domain-containing protein [Microbacterium]|uniref:Predicted membrane protein n=1 Tax=Microbacterium saccharophilum TaxID=1213358 RepID=A0A7Z7CVD7_9MICO|nr:MULTISPECIES: DUF2238 domain-containing protein [Microbacterium]SFI19332.1 Predicted membrane protein [Microbacterium saccharophilum]